MAGMKISGEYITKRARDMFWKDKRTYKDVSSFLIGLLGEQFKEHITPLLRDIRSWKEIMNSNSSMMAV